MYKELKGYIIFYAFTVVIFSAIIFTNIYAYRQKTALMSMVTELGKVKGNIEAIKTKMQETKLKQETGQSPLTPPDQSNHIKKTMAVVDEIRVKTGGNVVINSSLLADDIPLTISVKTSDFSQFINSLTYLKGVGETNNLFVTDIEGTKDGTYIIRGHIIK